MDPRRPKLAVFKFTSCDGCQLSLLDLEEELLAIAGKLEVAYFKEATRTELRGPYDLTLVEGSVSTPEQLQQVQQVRRASRFLVAIGACATAGGIQALRNFEDVQDYLKTVYPQPEHLKTLAESTPISAHVPVDLELQGCPISKHQLLEVVGAYLFGRRPQLPDVQRLSGVQTPGRHLRAGVPGPSLSGARHPGRLRRPVSFLPPGLLRLLRSQGDPQPRGPERLL